MLEKIKKYIESINIYKLSMSELADYTKIVIMLEQAEKNESDKKRIMDLLKEGRSNL